MRSATLQNQLKVCKLKSKPYCIGFKYDTVPDRRLEQYTFRQIWRLGFPYLIAIRLKVIYKDLFNNHRRYRAGLSDTPNCSVCGQVETVEHMLFECPNAERLWSLYSDLCGTDMPDCLYDAICLDEDIALETVKSLIFKTLISLDRGVNVERTALINKIKFHINIDNHSANSCNLASVLD